MKIIVPIKQVPETNAVRMDEQTGTMVRDGVEAIVNPLDLYAIEVAIQLRDTHSGEVVVVSMGPPKAEKAIREAIAMGCDSGVLLSDKAFAGSDTWATSYVIAKAIGHIGGWDMVICGERATDGDTGQVGPGIAAFLNVPVLSYISKIENISPASCTVVRLIEDGYETLESTLPCVLTVVKEIADPRLPTLRGKQKSRSIKVETITSQSLDFESEKLGLNGSPTRVVKIFRPQVTRTCQKLQAFDELAVNDACDKLVEFLKQKEII